MGVKEVKIETFIPGKTYLFFSHTFKLQPYNAKLLKAVLDNKIRLVDYEVIRAAGGGPRLIGFGRYAGVVGCYNGFRTFGLKHGLYELKPAHACEDRLEMEGELAKVQLPDSAKFVLTGWGRVGHGAREIMDLLPIQEVTKDAFLNAEHTGPVFTHPTPKTPSSVPQTVVLTRASFTGTLLATKPPSSPTPTPPTCTWPATTGKKDRRSSSPVKT